MVVFSYKYADGSVLYYLASYILNIWGKEILKIQIKRKYLSENMTSH